MSSKIERDEIHANVAKTDSDRDHIVSKRESFGLLKGGCYEV